MASEISGGTATATKDPRILSEARVKELKQCYETPHDVFVYAERMSKKFGIYGFGLDVAASERNRKHPYYISAPGERDRNNPMHRGRDGLVTPWNTKSPFGAAWCNPPFGLTKAFLPRAYNQALQGCFSVLLTQTDPSVAWWPEAEKHATARIDLHPRVNFIQHPDYLAHLEATGKTPGGNSGGNSLWFYNPWDIDRPDGCRVVKAESWRSV